MRIKKVTIVIVYKCSIPDELLKMKQDNLPEDIRVIINAQRGLPCKRDGIPGDWCRGCHWGDRPSSVDYWEE